MTGMLDFLDGGKIPFLAWTRKCQGSDHRPEPVMMGGYVLGYQCVYCAAQFTAAQVGDTGAPVAPAHEAQPGRMN
jgi:hypothetical protein